MTRRRRSMAGEVAHYREIGRVLQRAADEAMRPKPKLTTPQVRALAAVRDGLVSNRFDAIGNVFVGPKGIGPINYRKLQAMRLIEDVPKQAGDARPTAYRVSHKQQPTQAGRDVLAALNGLEPR